MSVAKRWLATPLAGTAGVMLGLCLIAIPLRKLTSASHLPIAPTVAATEPTTTQKQIPAVLRLKLLAPAKGLRIEDADGKSVLGPIDLEAGESEYDVQLPFGGDVLDLSLQATFASPEADSAVFLTVMPDAYEDQTRYIIGSGEISETLHYEWHVHAH